MTPQLQVADSLLASTLKAAAAHARLFPAHAACSRATGWAELTADTTLESDYILLQLWLHPPVNGVWNPPTRPMIDKAVDSILARQLPDGGFNIYPQGPAELQRHREGVLLAQGRRPGLSTIRAWRRHANEFWRSAAFRPRTATSRST